MKAWTYDRYGAPGEVLELTEVEQPKPDADEITIEVRAAGLNAADWHIMRADPALARLRVGLRKPRTRMVIGSDVAGVVEAVGSKVTRFSPGDPVHAEVMLQGACSAFTKVKADRAALIPESLDFTRAAAVPMAASTALMAVSEVGKLEPGQTVLVLGASGGVGTFAVQIAAAMGGVVTAVCSAKAAEAIKALGADEVIDYDETDITESGREFDLIVGVGGTASLGQLRKILAPRGTLAASGGSEHGGLFGPASVGLRGQLLSPFVRQRLVMVAENPSGKRLEELAAMFDAGKIFPVIDSTWTFDQVPDAVRHQEVGHPVGKVVIAL